MSGSWSWPETKQKLECPKDASHDNTTWCNRDLMPIPPDRRTYGVWSFLGYWAVGGSCIAAWSIGSTLLTFGLSPQQAIGVIVTGGILVGFLAVLCGWSGETHHIGFTVSSRTAWGMRGSYFPVILRVFAACMWFGAQAFWGGQATRVMIGAIIPGFAHMRNSFSPSSHLQTNDFIGLVIWMLAFVPALLIRPERMQIPFLVCFVLFCSGCIGLLIWAVHSANGVGSMFHEPSTTPNVGWAFMFGVTSIVGAWGSATLGQSDWTRYAKRRLAPTLSQLIAAPVGLTVTATIGIIATSAAHDVLGGELQWSPIYLLTDIQEHYHSSPGVRAGVFFAAVGMVFSQFAICVVLNNMSGGMDIAGLWPKYINIRRGGYLITVVGIATQPWQLLATADRFMTFLSSFSVFMGPASGIMLADYHIVRRHKLKLDDIYTGDASSIYWFRNGVNWRAIVAFVAGMAPLIPGLDAKVNSLSGGKWMGWLRLYNLAFLAGLAISLVVFSGLAYFFPMEGLGLDTPFVLGEIAESSSHSDEEGQARGRKRVATSDQDQLLRRPS